MRIYRVLNEAGIGAEGLHNTNSSRMRLIVMLPPNVLREEKDHWLLLARTLSAAKLDEKVRERLSQLAKGRSPRKPVLRSRKSARPYKRKNIPRNILAILKQN